MRTGRKNPLFLDETLSRTEFQKITQDLLDRTQAPFNQVLPDVRRGCSRIRALHPPAEGVEVFRLDQNLTCLRALGRTHDAIIWMIKGADPAEAPKEIQDEMVQSANGGDAALDDAAFSDDTRTVP